MAKRLYRSRSNRTVLGILGGLGEYWDVDPVVIRLIYVFAMFATAVVPLVMAYFIAYFIVPEAPSGQ